MIFVKISPEKASQKSVQVRQGTKIIYFVNLTFQAGLDVEANPNQSEAKPLQPISFIDAWRVKNVPFFAVSVFCAKGVYSGLMSWLPFYLTDTLQLPGVSTLSQVLLINYIIGYIGTVSSCGNRNVNWISNIWPCF
jgi:hypothetical protein